MGFCIFNNAALLARLLADRGKRVCIVDWDVHHGNGTQDVFEAAPEIGFCSLHQHPLYPGTGFAHERGAGNVLNLPLPAGCGDAEYLAVFERSVLPWVAARKPDVLVVSAGFDAHRDDPLAGMELSSEAYGRFTEMLLGRPILGVLEGGYDLGALGESARAHVEALVRA
jgi:acetoin utilization deacetylase AcuC-like enzyme